MASLGQKLALLRKEKGLSQTELAAQLKTSVSVISRYERDTMKPSAETVKKLADSLGSTVGYLMGDGEDSSLLKNPRMLERLKAISSFSEEDQERIYFTLDAMIHEVSNRSRYSR